MGLVRRLLLVLMAMLSMSDVSCINTAGWPQGRYHDQPLPKTQRIDRLVVHKDAQRMEAYAGDSLLKTYVVQVGTSSGPKRWEGDRRTPEGEYRIDSRHPSKAYHRFLHVSYPNAGDRRRYLELKQQNKVPKGAGVGFAIGIHGEPRGGLGSAAASMNMNWTAGCIAVTDEEIEELYRAVIPNAQLQILP